MSSPAQGGPSVPKDKEKKGFGKMLSRMKTVLKPSSRRLSTLSPAGPSAAAPTSAAAATKKAQDGPEPSKVPRSKIHAERAQKLAERYGLELKPSEWLSTEGDVQRVDKPIRMRVHRICHECNTAFGTTKECPKCKHPRCKQCTRYPPKRTEAEKVASRERRAQMLKERKENAPIVPDPNPDRSRDIVLKKPSKTGGQDLVHRKPRQRVRRTCCECKTLFTSGVKTCGQCSHTRCTDCPRDPSKKDKYPYGYPGDEFGKNSIPHHQCHECKTNFAPSAEDGTQCSNCEHKKCSDCPRLKPRKIIPEADPDILKSVQAKIDALKLTGK